MQQLKIVFFEEMSAIGSSTLHHGDCALAFLPDGGTLLIDAGEAGVGTHLTRQIRALGVEHIDWLLISHLHGDHVGGFPEMAQELSFGRVLFSGYGEGNPAAEQAGLAEIRRLGIPVELIEKGQNMELGGALMQVLSPASDAPTVASDGEKLTYSHMLNQYSTVVRLSWGSFSMLFAADINQPAEEELTEEYGDALHSTILKIPHHGHRGSCTDAFMERVAPRLALHMGKDMDAPVMHAFTSRCIPIYSTATDGCITLETDGSSLRIDCDKGVRILPL